LKRLTEDALLLVTALFLAFLGILGVILPVMPGIPFLVLALLLLSKRFRWAKSLLGKLEKWKVKNARK